MKRRLLGIFIPVLAGVAVIGAGFSTWYFTGYHNADLGGIAVDMEGYAELGNLKLPYGSFRLHVDSVDDGGISMQNRQSEEDEWQDIGETSLSFELELSGMPVGELSDHPLGLDIQIKASTDVRSYIDFSIDGTSLNDDSSTYTMAVPKPANEGNPYYIVVPAFEFSFKSDGSDGTAEPDTSAEWDAMNAALNGESISITYTIYWVDNN